eukprot:COSAG04_NODE_11814_length_687_cov_0.858844_2_plen_45_part_01
MTEACLPPLPVLRIFARPGERPRPSSTRGRTPVDAERFHAATCSC